MIGQCWNRATWMAAVALTAGSLPEFAVGKTIHVPQDQRAIQPAIDAARDGDTVLVAPGVYQVYVRLGGKTITLASRYHTTVDERYVEKTVIDGGPNAREEDGIQLIDYPDVSPRTYLIERNVIVDSAMAGIGCMADGNTDENYEAASISEPGKERSV